MKIRSISIERSQACGGLLDEFAVAFGADRRNPWDPICIVGPNGSGKSQLLQHVAEIFQVVLAAVVPREEREPGPAGLEFEIIYEIANVDGGPTVVRATRSTHRTSGSLVLERQEGEAWKAVPVDSSDASELIPSRIVGYSSGDNETLSLPFIVSRGGYAGEVRDAARSPDPTSEPVPESRLMLLDYSTHIELLVSNLLLGTDEARVRLIHHAGLETLHSFRCVVRLQPSSVKSGPVMLTAELAAVLANLQACATTFTHNEKRDEHILDFVVTDTTREAFRAFWETPLDLYTSLHKLAMLNDLAIPRASRERFRRDATGRRFASRLPEPQDEDKVFLFERVMFAGPDPGRAHVDYVSLSDGEHQLAQVLSAMSMIDTPNCLFLLDEPESHLNPQWRIEFVSRLLDVPTRIGTRRFPDGVVEQDCLLTTHAPFAPSSMARNRVIVFRRDEESGAPTTRLPASETFGATFDAILSDCFEINPPISEEPRVLIDHLMESSDEDEIARGIVELGESSEKLFLADRLRRLSDPE